METRHSQTQRAVTSYWNTRSAVYDAHPASQLHMNEAKATWMAILESALPPPPADVLDVGTGTGFLSLMLAELGHRVVGIDLAEEMLATARTKASAMSSPPRLELGDAVAPDFPPQSFDVITNRYLLWTIRDPDQALANWQRLLRPGGRLVVIDGVWFPRGWRPDGDRHDPAYWDELLSFYTAETRAGLPLAEERSFPRFVERVEAAGYDAVRVTELHDIERIEREHAAELEAEVEPQYLITARARA